MNFLLSRSIAVALLLGAFPAFAEDAPPPPDAPAGEMGGRDGQRRMGMGMPMRMPMMSEDDAAKFSKLNADMLDALGACRATPNDANRAVLREKIAAMVDARQAFEIERATKALERAKAAVAEKDKIVERHMKQMLSPERKPEARPKAEQKPERRKSEQKPEMRRNLETIMFTPDEGAKLLALRNDLKKLEPASAEAAKNVGALKALFEQALVHVRADLAKARTEKQPAEKFEQAEKFLLRQIEACADPVKYAERTRRGPVRNRQSEEVKKPQTK